MSSGQGHGVEASSSNSPTGMGLGSALYDAIPGTRPVWKWAAVTRRILVLNLHF